MLLDPLARYLLDIESAVTKVEKAYVERFEEEVLAANRVNLRIRVRFVNGDMLELNEAVVCRGKSISHLGYRYHLQDRENKLVFRYDNTPHYPDVPTFPHHKHLPGKVIGVTQPSILDVIKEARERSTT